MDENKDKQWLKKLFAKKGEGKKKKATTLHYFAMVLCVGVALMILGSFFSSSDDENDSIQPVFKNNTESVEDEAVFGQKKGSDPNSMEDYEIRYENQLKEAIDQIIGVTDATVMINLAETETKVYEKNVNTKKQQTDETDREGGKRKVDDATREEQVVVLRSGDTEEPLLVKEEKPEVRGVLVVAEGVENIQVKSMVVEAVSRVLDVPAHRVSVLPKKSKEE